MTKIYLDTIPMNPELLENSDSFWEHIYLNHLKPLPECNICKSEIKEPKSWLSFSCGCQVFYCKTCLYRGKNEFRCCQCESTQILTFSRFIKKFLPRDEYVELYQKTIANLSPEMELKVYEIWFNSTVHSGAPLLDMYRFQRPHNPRYTCSYIEAKKRSGHSIQCHDPAFNEENDSLSYNTGAIDYNDKKVLADVETFKVRFMEYSYNLMDLDKFPFGEYVYLSGGAVHKCLDTRINMKDVKKYSDIDIFVCHPDSKVVSRENKKIVKYFQEALGNDIYWARNKQNIIYLFVSGYSRVIKIHLYKNHISSIISRFDYSHCQFVFNGKSILTTPKGIEYCNSLVTSHLGLYDCSFTARYFKAKYLNLCIVLPSVEVDEVSEGVYPFKSWFPNYTDSLTTIKHQVHNLLDINKQYITKFKPCRILYSKLPNTFTRDTSMDEGTYRHLFSL